MAGTPGNWLQRFLVGDDQKWGGGDSGFAQAWTKYTPMGWGLQALQGKNPLDTFTGGSPELPETPDWEDLNKDANDEAAKKMEGLYGTIDDLTAKAGDIPTFTEWLQQQGLGDSIGDTEAMQGVQGLISGLENGPTAEDQEAAYAHAARLMGLDPAEAEAMIGNLTESLAGGIDAQQGLSPEEMAMRQRQNQMNVRQVQETQQRMVQDSLADTGSTARMLQSADQATRTIANVQMAQDAQLAQEDFERSLAEFQGQKEMWAQMVSTNQMGYGQYIDQMQQSMGLALQGYATQLDAMFQSYQGDMQGMMAQIDGLYKAATLELGVTQAELDMAAEIYAAATQPYWDQINSMTMESELAGDSFFDQMLEIGLAVIPFFL